MAGVPASSVKLTIPADSLRKLPEGAVYRGKSGQANLTVGSDDSGNIVAEASCDSLQQLVLWYEEELARIRSETKSEISNDVQTVEKRPSEPDADVYHRCIGRLACRYVINNETEKKMNKNFMYGIGAVKYKDFTIGYIEKNSFDLGGKKPEAAKIEAEQVQGAPVLVIPQSNGGIAPTFNVIQMNYSNLHKLLGGSLHYKKEDLEKKTPIGWTAPSEVLVMQGPWELSLVSGQSVLIPNATLLSNPAGKLTLTETSKIEVTLEVAMPEDGSQPYGVFDTEAIPDEWGQYKLPPAEAAAAASLQSEEG